MTRLAVEHVYRYQQASQLRTQTSTPHLQLATGHGIDLHPCFFEGRLVRPKLVADLLRTLTQVVHARYHLPPAALAALIALADPVVTSSEQRLRFEGFSGCCSVYSRVDLLPDAIVGEQLGRGTTNVDFNPTMLSALARVRTTDTLQISVGHNEFQLRRSDETVVEKKVALPLRWLKGFLEVQTCQSRMQPMFRLTDVQTAQFLRSLPRAATGRQAFWIVRSGRGLRLSQNESRDAVRVAGIQRLRVLESLAHSADQLTIYRDAVTEASAWELSFGDARFCLVLSPEVWRGFSGEGQALTALAAADRNEALAAVQAQLRWQTQIDFDRLTQNGDIQQAAVRNALAVLAARGLVGYDLADNAWFHRELPFDLSAVEQLQPRLRSARRLLDKGKVSLRQRQSDVAELLVEAAGIFHRVRVVASDAKCTCPWFAKHPGDRGPCKHILAAEIFLEEDSK